MKVSPEAFTVKVRNFKGNLAEIERGPSRQFFRFPQIH
jgi:hypothetical protein